MQLTEYAERIRAQILQTPNVLFHSLAYDDRPPTAGLVKGVITFADGSQFHFKEFLSLTGLVTRLKYAYHYASASGALIFRYDNALDAAAKHLASYPHHKHLPERIVPSESPLLDQALTEAARSIKRG